ncbi:MAG: glutamyl-tRNA reductase [Actinomycetota bacterium]
MSLVLVGVNHRTSPVGLLERLAISEDMLPKALHHLLTYEHVLEGAVLSTCNRVDVCAVVSRFHGGAQDLRNFLAEFCHVAPEEFSDHLYTLYDDGAARHLFRVAAGVDSMVVGESEILGQVRRAFQVAVEEGAARRVLGRAFRQALSVGKRARTETAIGRNPVSFSSAAVTLARRGFAGESLAAKRVLIVGAGKMGSLTLQALAAAGVNDVTLISRSESAARIVADVEGARTRPLGELGDALALADIVISSTTSPEVVLDRRLVHDALKRRGHDAPLFIADIAVPRDVEASVDELPGVILRDIDDLRSVVEANIGGRVEEVSKVEEIVAEELERFKAWELADELAPTIGALVARADDIRRAEMLRAETRLGALTPEQLSTVDHLTRRIVAKLLHTPIRNARELAGSKQGYLYLQAVRELFELDDEPRP